MLAWGEKPKLEKKRIETLSAITGERVNVDAVAQGKKRALFPLSIYGHGPSTGTGPMPADRSDYFVAGHRRVSASGAFQKPLGLCDIAALASHAEVLFGPQGRQLLGHRDVDELIERHALGFGNAACLFQYGLLQTQCNVTSSHAFESPSTLRLAASLESRTREQQRQGDAR